MTIITNHAGLPDALVRAVEAIRSWYDRGRCDFSVTELDRPPLQLRLMRDHESEIRVEAVDTLWAIFGTAVHRIMEAGADEDQLAEARFIAKVGGWMVSGQADLYNPYLGVLQDWKVTSAWSYVFGGKKGKPEWEHQLNHLAHLIRLNGGKIEMLENVLLFRDWSPKESRSKDDYPQQKAVVIRQKLWASEEAENSIIDRCSVRQRALEDQIENIPVCTPDERWERPTTWAVMKTGRKSAVKVHDNLASAVEHAAESKTLSVSERPGRRVNCEDYCDVASWCPDWQRVKSTSTTEVE